MPHFMMMAADGDGMEKILLRLRIPADNISRAAAFYYIFPPMIIADFSAYLLLSLARLPQQVL